MKHSKLLLNDSTQNAKLHRINIIRRSPQFVQHHVGENLSCKPSSVTLLEVHSWQSNAGSNALNRCTAESHNFAKSKQDQSDPLRNFFFELRSRLSFVALKAFTVALLL